MKWNWLVSCSLQQKQQHDPLTDFGASLHLLLSAAFRCERVHSCIKVILYTHVFVWRHERDGILHNKAEESTPSLQQRQRDETEASLSAASDFYGGKRSFTTRLPDQRHKLFKATSSQQYLPSCFPSRPLHVEHKSLRTESSAHVVLTSNTPPNTPKKGHRSNGDKRH